MATPRCPYCNTQGIGHVALQRLELFGLVYCSKCGAIYGVIPLPLTPKKAESPKVTQQEPPAPPPVITTPKPPPTGSLDEIGNADLSQKAPYDPVQLANRVRAAGASRGSRYLHIAVDDGPPLCTYHKVEMVKTTIPGGYKNAGQEVWLCPDYKNCHQWELAKK